MMRLRLAVLLLVTVLLSALTTAQDAPTRLLRYPAISKDLIAFVYAGDIWLVPIGGGYARQLTSVTARSCFRASRPMAGRSRSPASTTGGGRCTRSPWRAARRPQLTFYNDAVRPAAARRRRQPRARVDAGWQAGAVQRAPHAVERAQRASLCRARRGRHRAAAGRARGRGRLAVARRQAVRVHAGHARVPHVEAVPRRPRAGRLDLRPRREHLRAHHRLRRHRQPAGLAGRHDLLHVGSRRQPEAESLGARRPHAEAERRSRPTTATTCCGRAAARPASCTRTAATSTGSIRRPARAPAWTSAWPATFAARCPTTRSVKSEIQSAELSPTGKRALIEAHGDVFTAPGKGRRDPQPDLHAGHPRNGADLVAERPLHRVPLRSHGRVRDLRASGGRIRRGAPCHDRWRHVAVSAGVVARLAGCWPTPTSRNASASSR